MYKLPIFAVGVFILFIILAHLFVPASYIWTRNTISELASQGYKTKWLMQIGFMAFGLLFGLSMIMVLIRQSGIWYRELPFMIYAGAVFLSGIFCAKPFIGGIEFSVQQANIHSVFAQIAGVAFSIGILIHGIVNPNLWGKVFHFDYFIFVIAFSLLFGVIPSHAGIMQRILYLGSFSWIIITYGIRLNFAIPK